MIQTSGFMPQHPLLKLLLSFIITVVSIKALAVVFYDRAPFCSFSSSTAHAPIHSTPERECPTQEPVVQEKEVVKTVMPNFEETIQTLFHQRKVAVDAPYFVDRFGENQTLGRARDEIAWDKPLGKRLCIVDIDTRGLDGQGDLLDLDTDEWVPQRYTTSGMLNHYIYATLHGYTYKFIRTQPLEDRAVFWTKIDALAETLTDECEITISIDADATFMNYKLPFEWLLNRWGTTKNTSLTMARDPDRPQNYESKGGLLLNCGFVVAQNLPRTQEILAAWSSCPDDEERFPDCAKWKWPWPAEQAAFGEYIRYEFDQPTDIHAINCSEANGFPEADQGCEGTFIRHHWSRKDLVWKMLTDGWMEVSTEIFHDRFVNQMKQHVITKTNAATATPTPTAAETQTEAETATETETAAETAAEAATETQTATAEAAADAAEEVENEHPPVVFSASTVEASEELVKDDHFAEEDLEEWQRRG